jgi:hypothetical protein
MKKRLGILLLALLVFAGCKEGSLIDNLPPETKIFLKEINLSGEDRLNSVVRLHWTGEDPDGYITGYEISFDEVNWDFVTIQDSTFRFSLSIGTDTADIDFYVRAIDNAETTDPSPAYLKVPIRNTPPVVRLDTVKLIPDTVYSVFSVLWAVEDLDGPETIDSVLIRLNDGAWYVLDPGVNFVSLIPEFPMQTGSQQAKVYQNLSPELLPVSMEDIRPGEPNRFSIRVVDLAGASSEVDTSRWFFIKPQTSDLVVIDDHSALVNPKPEVAYFSILNAVYPQFDYWDISRAGADVPVFWDPTFGLFLSLYDKVFWYSDGVEQSNLNGRLFLEAAATQVQLFLNGGGKVLISTNFPSSFTDNSNILANTSPIFGFSPIDSLSTSSGQVRIPKDSLIMPRPAFAGRFDTLKCRAFITGADPYYPKNEVNDIYRAQLSISGGWVGPRTVIGRTSFTNEKTNQVFASVELHLFDGNPGTLQSFFDEVLNQEFDW